MPPAKHAILSASSSHRWLNCNPSARLEQEFADRETDAAAEGTAAHALCEHKLRRALKRLRESWSATYGGRDGTASTPLRMFLSSRISSVPSRACAFARKRCLVVNRTSSCFRLPLFGQ